MKKLTHILRILSIHVSCALFTLSSSGTMFASANEDHFEKASSFYSVVTPDFTDTLEICDQTEIEIFSNLDCEGIGEWSIINGPGTIADPAAPIALITDLIPGQTTIAVWTVMNESCPADSDTIVILNNLPPEPANAGPDQYLCEGTTSTVMAATPLLNATGQWFLEAGSGTFSDINDPYATLYDMEETGNGVIIAYWSSDAYCPNSDVPTIDAMYIYFTSAPGPAEIYGDTLEICDQTEVEVFASDIFEGTGEWSIINGPGTITDPAAPIALITDLIPGQTTIAVWTVMNESCPADSDTIVIINNLPPEPANAGPDQYLCEGTTSTVMAATPLLNATGQWFLEAGSGTFSDINDPNATLYDIEETGNGEIIAYWSSDAYCPNSEVPTIDAMYIYFVPASGPAEIYGDTLEICDQTEVEVYANDIFEGTGEWSIINGPGTISAPASPIALITDLIPGQTTIAVWTIANESCPADSDTIVIINNLPPEPANAGPDQYLCEGTTSTVMAATPLLNATGQWFLEAGSGTFSDINDPNATLYDIEETGNGVIIAYWSSDAYCPNSDVPTIDVMYIYFVPASGPAIILNDYFEICNQTEFALEAEPIYEGVGQWSVISGPGSFADPGSNSTTIQGLTPGQNTIVVWTVTNETCPPAVDTLTIYNAAPPEPVNAGPDQYFCEGVTSTTLNATPLQESIGEWVILDGFGVISNLNDPNAEFTEMVPGADGFILLKWETNAFCEEAELPAFDLVFIYFDEMPDAAQILTPDTVLCNASSLPVTAVIPMIGTGVWSILSGEGNFINPNNPTTVLNNIVPGTTSTIRWTVSNGVCPDNFQEISIQNTNYTPAANAGADQSICAHENLIQLSATSPAIGQGTWNIVSGSGAISQINAPNAQLSNFSPNADNQLILEWTITGDVCHEGNNSGVDSIIINISPLPGPAVILTPDTILCAQTTLDFEADPNFYGTGNWTIVSGPGNIGQANMPLSSVSGLIPGQNTIIAWTIRSEGCPPVTEQLLITNSILSAPANAGSSQSFCGIPPSVTLQATTPNAGTGTWSVLSGSAMINQPNQANSTITNIIPNSEGILLLQWTINGDFCLESNGQHTDQVQIAFFEPAGPAQILNTSSLFCAVETLELQASDTYTGIGTWTIVSGPGNINDPFSSSTSIQGLIPGSNTVVQWTVSNGACPEVSDIITIQNTIQTPAAMAGPDQTICINQPFIQLNAQSPVTGIGSWNILSGGGGFSSLNAPNATISPFIPNSSGQLILTWTIQNDVCHTTPETAVDTIIIQVDQLPSTANILTPNSELCSLNELSIAAEMPSVGSGIWAISGGPGSIADVLNTTTLVSYLIPGQTTTISWTVSNGACPESTDLLLLSNFISYTPDAGPDQILCETESAQLAANNIPGAFWQILSGTANVSNPSNPTALLNGLLPGNSYTLSWNIQSQACPLFSDTVSVEIVPTPAPADAGNDQIVCYENFTSLQSGGGEGTWALISGSGNVSSPNSAQTEVNEMAFGTNLFTWTLTYDGLCPLSVDTVEVLLIQMPETPDAGPDQTICNTNTATLNAVPVAGGYWTLIEGPGTILDVFDPNTTVFDLVPGQVSAFRWNVGGDICPAVSDVVLLNILPGAEFTNAGTDQQICFQNQTFLTAQPDGGYWSVIQGGALFEDINNPNSGVSNLASGTNILQWNVSFDGLCPLSTDQIIIEFTPLPEVFSAGSDITVCEQNSTSLNGASSSPGFWTLINGQATIAQAHSPATQINNFLLDQQILLSWNTQIAGCPLLSDSVLVQTFSAPVANAGQDIQQCYIPEVNIQATPENGIWSVIQGNGTFTQSTSSATLISGLSPGNNIIVWTALYDNGCPSTIDTLLIELTPAPQAPEAGPDQIICSVAETLLGATPAAAPTIGYWSWVSGPGNIENPNSPNSPITGLVEGMSTHVSWNVSNGNCPEISDTMTIQVLNIPPDANAGPDQSICADFSATLNANLPAGTGFWLLISGMGSIDEPSNPQSTISNLSAGENIFRWTYSAGNNCPDLSDEVSIFVYLTPDIADAGDDLHLCENQPIQLNANSPVIGNGNWNLISGTAVVNNPNAAQTSLSGFFGESTLVLSWNIANGNCPVQSDTIQIDIDALPSTALAGMDQRWCEITTTQLQAINPLIGEGMWALISGSGSIQNPANPSTHLQNLSYGTTQLSWTVSNGLCPASVDFLEIIVDENPVASVENENISDCDITELILPANTPSVGTGNWQLISGSGNFSQANQPNTIFTGFIPDQNNVLQWIVSNGVCPSDTAIINVLINALPSVADAGNNQIACQSELELMANTPVTGSGMWTILNGQGNISNSNIPNPVLSGLSNNESLTLAWTISNGVCPVSSDTISIDVHSVFLNAGIGPDIALCSANETILQAAAPPLGASGMWTIISGPGSIINPENAQTTIEQLVPDQNTLLIWSISDGTCSAFSDTLQIENTDGASISANFLVNELSCLGDTLYLIDISDIPEELTVSYSWDFGNNTSGNQRDPVLMYDNAGEYTIRMSVSLGACTSTSPLKKVEVALCRPEDELQIDRFNFAKIYPTVNTGTFFIELERHNKESISLMEIFHINGKLIQQRQYSGKHWFKEEVNVNSPGVYIVKVTNGSYVNSFRMIVH